MITLIFLGSNIKGDPLDVLGLSPQVPAQSGIKEQWECTGHFKRHSHPWLIECSENNSPPKTDYKSLIFSSVDILEKDIFPEEQTKKVGKSTL